MRAIRKVVNALDGRDILVAIGLLLVAAGLAFVSPAWSFISVGAVLLYLGVWHPILLQVITTRRQ